MKLIVFRLTNTIILILSMVVLLITAMHQKAWSGDSDLIDIRDAYINILNIVHGGKVLVSPTDHYCEIKGLQDSRKHKKGSVEWYNQTGNCEAYYIPNIKLLSSPLTHAGMIEHFFFDKYKYSELLINLEILVNKLTSNTISNFNILRKLDMQVSFWEMVIALEWRRNLNLDWSQEINQDAMDSVLSRVHLVLKRLLFSEEDIASIPDNLKDLASDSEFNQYKSIIDKITSNSSDIFEDNFPTVVHSEVTGKRLNQRVFITSSNVETLSRLKEFFVARSLLTDEFYVPTLGLKKFDWLNSEKIIAIRRHKNYEDLKNYLSPYSGKVSQVTEFAYLHRWLPDIRTILVTYFNVLDNNYKIHETSLVNSWREIKYLGKINVHDTLDNIEQGITINAFDYQKILNFDSALLEPNYKHINDDDLARFGISDVSPAIEVNVRSHLLQNLTVYVVIFGH